MIIYLAHNYDTSIYNKNFNLKIHFSIAMKVYFEYYYLPSETDINCPISSKLTID